MNMQRVALKLLGILVLFSDLSLQEQNVSVQHKRRKSTGNIKISHGGQTKILHRQKRAWIIDTFELEEELPGPYPKLIGTVNIDEGGTQLKYALKGKGIDLDPKGLFHINEEDGSIYVHQKIDYEATPVFRWEFHAINKTTLKVGTKLGIQLKILDINDNAPTFDAKTYKVSVNESFVQGVTFFTLFARDLDDQSSPNSQVNYALLSQTPTDPNVEFIVHKEKGFLSFKGCLNYEINKNYKLVIQAKDNGELVQQSSQCEIQVLVLDYNTHPPMWSSENLKGTVLERDVNVTIMRFGVTDKDTPFTSAWRAVYSIVEGNENENYMIETDPQTNEGLLWVVKPLDYEKSTQSKLSITVTNEEPLFSCKILERPPSGLWIVESAKPRAMNYAPQESSVVVDVLDANDPPKFTQDNLVISLEENSLPPGSVLGTLTAVDADIVSPNKIKYFIMNDPGDWLSVDENTGVVTSKAILDRESDHVIRSKYTVTVLAVDDGDPSMTGTATLVINLKDVNDNTPTLVTPYLTTCENDKEIIFNIPVIDKDLVPYSGPFYFEILDKDLDKKQIKLMEVQEESLSVKKLKDAHQGNHTLHFDITDRQGVGSLQNFTLYVCDCLNDDVCLEKIPDPPTLSGGAIALILLAPALLLAMSFILCKIQTKKVMVPMEHEPLNSFIAYNEEGGNIDCQASAILMANSVDQTSSNQVDGPGAAFHRTSTKRSSVTAAHDKKKTYRSQSLQVESFKGQQVNTKVAAAFDRSSHRRHSSYNGDRRGKGFDRASARRHSVQAGQRFGTAATRKSIKNYNSRTLDTVLKQKLRSCVEDIYGSKPRVFTEEGELSKASSLEAISIYGSAFQLENLENLGSKFNILESICAEKMLSEQPST
ncbi:cadherin-like protein 26 [Discoglossus pictus]